ncbi:MAG: hypothetical protein LBC51_07485 [Treponema sp.]|jgi:hypothetical protein|nr:hypothetical protein [Treponema sp.]
MVKPSLAVAGADFTVARVDFTVVKAVHAVAGVVHTVARAVHAVATASFALVKTRDAFVKKTAQKSPPQAGILRRGLEFWVKGDAEGAALPCFPGAAISVPSVLPVSLPPAMLAELPEIVPPSSTHTNEPSVSSSPAGVTPSRVS